MVKTLEQAFHVNAFQLGLLSSAFFVAYVAMQIPVGALIDRYGPRKLFVIAVFLCAIGCIVFGTTHSFEMLYVGRFLIGFGGAFSFIGTLTLVRHWFPAKHFAVLAGATQGLGMAGAYIGGAPISEVFHALGWRETLIYTAILFIGLLILIILFVKDHPKEHAEYHRNQPKRQISIIQDLMTVLKNKQTWLNGLYIGMTYGPTVVFATQWGASYIAQDFHHSITVAAGEVGMMFVGLAVGCPLIGWLSDRHHKRLPWMRASAIICIISICLLIYGDNFMHLHWLGSAWGITLLAFVYGLGNSGIIPSYALASEITDEKHTGIALGFANFSSLIIGAILLPFVGYILDIFGHIIKTHDTFIYPTSSYQVGFIALPICFVIAFFATILIKEPQKKRPS